MLGVFLYLNKFKEKLFIVLETRVTAKYHKAQLQATACLTIKHLISGSGRTGHNFLGTSGTSHQADLQYYPHDSSNTLQMKQRQHMRGAQSSKSCSDFGDFGSSTSVPRVPQAVHNQSYQVSVSKSKKIILQLIVDVNEK